MKAIAEEEIAETKRLVAAFRVANIQKKKDYEKAMAELDKD